MEPEEFEQLRETRKRTRLVELEKECFQSAGNEVGLDRYQVRRYDAWYRQTPLVMLAHVFLAVTAIHSPKAQAATSSRLPSRKSDVS